MIEDKIIEWIELGDSIQKNDIYNKKFTHILFQGYYLLSKFGQFSEYFYLLNIFLFFAQIWEMNLLKIEVEGDGILEILKYLENIFLFYNLAKNTKTFIILLIVTVLIYILYILLLIINIALIKKKKKIKIFISLNSFLNILIMYFINGPSLYLLLSSILCYNDNNVITLCSFKNASFILSFILDIIYAIFMVLSLLFSSLYFNNIGMINGSNARCRINCNFTTIIVIIKLIYNIFNFILNIFIVEDRLNHEIYEYYLFIFFGNLFISIYTYKYLFYYNQIINNCFHYGWHFTTWFSFCIFLKKLIGINDITLYVIIGLIIIAIGFYYKYQNISFRIMTEFNIFENNSLKEIEIYNYLLLNLLKKKDFQNKVILAGIIKKFEEYLRTNEELSDQYHKFLDDKHLQRKFTSKKELAILSMISIIYAFSIEKSNDKTDITLNMCYFLVNKFKNPTYSIWLCTKIKSFTHIQSYNIFVLMEEIKEYLIGKLNKNSYKISIKHIQFSSAILYNQYIEIFKMKIYDATCSQIEYFDILKNNATTGKATENFLKIGEEILSLKKDILDLWEKIIYLNPFSNESERDYIIYLDNVLQDEVLLKTEEKRFNSNKAMKLAERNNTYYSMYIQELSAVLLIDGYSYNGKVIYATPNLPSLFMFTEKEILNISIDDLLPDVIQTFHRFLIEDSIKYSNLGYIFKKQIDALLKGKNGLIFNIYLFIRPVPNLSFGLIYFCYIQKIKEQNFILITDENLYINGFTVTNKVDSNFTMNNNKNIFGLTNYINGHHLGLIIPEILLQMKYDDKSGLFSLTKTGIDLKGNLYPISNFQNSNDKIKIILDAIKKAKSNEFNGENKLTSFEEYDEFIKYLNSINPKSYSIFFRIEFLSFIGGRYKYYRIYITKDLSSCNESSLSTESNVNSLNAEEEANLNDYLHKTNQMNKLKIFKIKTYTNRSPQKLIKLKTNLNKINENEVNEQNDINEKKANENNKQNLLNNSNNNKNPNINFSKRSNPSSILTQSSTESGEFNKLKNEIINKNDGLYIKLMKYLFAIFAIINMGLIIYDFWFSYKIINIMIEFLRQNIFFSHTKISVACIYYSSVNLKLIKKGYFEQDFCITDKCYVVYGKLLEKCLKEVRKQKYNISLFFDDYQNIFKQKIHVNLDIYDRPYTNHLALNINNFLNLIISHGMRILADLKDVFESNLDKYNMGILETYLENLIKNSLIFFYSDYSGFYEEEKYLKCQKVSNNPPLRIMVSYIMDLLLMIIFIYLIYYINSIELYFLDILINFSSSSFEDYLKNLDKLKKKFRDDTNDEDDKNIDELPPDGDDIDLKKDNSPKIKKENNIIKEKNPKKKKSKQNKILQQKLKKKKIMSKYFYKINTFFGLKIAIFFLLTTLYFFLTTIITSIVKKNHKKFDSMVEQINKVYLDSFEIFLTFLEQIENFSNHNNRTLLKFPEDSEIEKPKFGNTLLYISKQYKNLEEASKFDIIYNNNACQIIAEDLFDAILCELILSSIISKGIEQAVIQMDIIITNVIDELNALKEYKTLNDLIHQNSTYSEYELFMGKFMLFSFLKTQEIFDVFRKKEKSYIFKITRITLYIYGIIYCFLLIFVFCFITNYKNVINSFFNFIGILPSKFISDDENFLNTILKLEKKFY